MMEDDRAVKRMYLGLVTIKRAKISCDSKYRCIDKVTNDLRELQVDEWKESTLDKNKFRLIVSEAKNHFRSLSKRSKKRIQKLLL